jgi:hypothetical protein
VLVSQGDTACSRRYGNLLYLLIDDSLARKIKELQVL